MNILEGIKPNPQKTSSNQTITKFIIKSKPSLKQNKIQLENDHLKATNDDVEQFLNHMFNKSKRFKDIIQQSRIYEIDCFIQKHLYGSYCIKTLLKGIIEKMLLDRRLGKNLKGINKSILQQIQNGIWSSLERQIALYTVNKKYEDEKQKLKANLQRRKKQIQNEIKNLQNEKQSKQEQGSQIQEI